MRATFALAVLAVLGFQATAEPPAIRFPETTVAPAPAPKPVPGAAEKLSKGQWYVIDSNKPLLVDAFGLGTGSVSVANRKGPLTIPAEVAVGRKPDKDDPEVVTIPGPYVYVVKALTTGKVIVDVLPAENDLKDGKPVPFTRADVKRRTLEVDAGNGPLPPPGPEPVSELVAAIKAAYGQETTDRPLVAPLAGVYTVGAVKATTAATWGELFSAMSDEATRVGAAGKLSKVQAVIATYLKANLPSTGAGTLAIDEAGRKKAAAAFAAVSTALTEATK